MRRRERVMVSAASACHDEDQFDHADQLVLDRFPNRHVAFGLSPHRCPGMHLARLELRTMVRRMLDRAPDYVIDERAAAMYPDQGTVAGWTSLPATFTPGSRVLSD
jgi:cytochrome P450